MLFFSLVVPSDIVSNNLSVDLDHLSFESLFFLVEISFFTFPQFCDTKDCVKPPGETNLKACP